jgi:uncharacterized protein GlcG (DUF336 family)
MHRPPRQNMGQAPGYPETLGSAATSAAATFGASSFWLGKTPLDIGSTMIALSLQQAAEIVESGLARARELRLKPPTIAMLDAGGHLVALKREDRSGILRAEIAQGKAWGALGMRFGGRPLAHRAKVAPAIFVSLANASQGRVFPVSAAC